MTYNVKAILIHTIKETIPKALGNEINEEYH